MTLPVFMVHPALRGCHSGSCPRFVGDIGQDLSSLFCPQCLYSERFSPRRVAEATRRVRHTQGGLAGMTFQAGVNTSHRKSSFQCEEPCGRDRWASKLNVYPLP